MTAAPTETWGSGDAYERYVGRWSHLCGGCDAALTRDVPHYFLFQGVLFKCPRCGKYSLP